MRTRLNNSFGLALLIALPGSVLTGQAPAQTFRTLYSFSASQTNSSGVNTNSDGANPHGGLVLSGNTLYGTAVNGGSSGIGAVFAVYTDGTGFTNLHNFTGGSDGANPYAGLVLAGNALYGTTYNAGTVFAINTDGSGFRTLYAFGSSPGSGDYPQAGLALSGDTLYGAATTGAGSGTLFSINTNGTGFGVFYTFSFLNIYGFNTDGADPQGGLVLSPSKTVYGTATQGGGIGQGTVFRLDPGGTGWWMPCDFYGIGEYPQASLVLASNNLYGTSSGPPYGIGGTVFAVDTDGSNPRALHGFTGGSDGGTPVSRLIISGNTLYGSTSAGGSSGSGTVFRVNTDGSDFANVYSFSAVSGLAATNSDGANPRADLVLSGNTLYGTTSAGGTSGNGTLFSISLPVTQLTIIPAGKNVILMWPTNAAGFSLESATNLVSPTAWKTNSPAPVVVDGQYIVTNPVSGTQQFFRLSQ